MSLPYGFMLASNGHIIVDPEKANINGQMMFFNPNVVFPIVHQFHPDIVEPLALANPLAREGPPILRGTFLHLENEI